MRYEQLYARQKGVDGLLDGLCPEFVDDEDGLPNFPKRKMSIEVDGKGRTVERLVRVLRTNESVWML